MDLRGATPESVWRQVCERQRIERLSRQEFDAQFGMWDGGELLVGWTQRPDTEIIMQLLRWKNPKVIFEIGTCLGHMTTNLCHNSRADAEVYTLDICEDMNIRINQNDRPMELATPRI